MTSPLPCDVEAVLVYDHTAAESGGYGLFVYCMRCYVDQYDWIERYYGRTPLHREQARAWSIKKGNFGDFSQHCDECRVLIHRGKSRDIAIPSKLELNHIMMQLVTKNKIPPSSSPVLSLEDRRRIILEDLYPAYPDLCQCPDCGMLDEDSYEDSEDYEDSDE